MGVTKHLPRHSHNATVYAKLRLVWLRMITDFIRIQPYICHALEQEHP